MKEWLHCWADSAIRFLDLIDAPIALALRCDWHLVAASVVTFPTSQSDADPTTLKLRSSDKRHAFQ
jgi:hypothetical protein